MDGAARAPYAARGFSEPTPNSNATREEALAIAAECPAAQWCTVEVRQAAPCWDANASR